MGLEVFLVGDPLPVSLVPSKLATAKMTHLNLYSSVLKDGVEVVRK